MGQPSIKPQYGAYGYQSVSQQSLYRPVRYSEVTPEYKDGDSTEVLDKKSRKLAFIIWGCSPGLCLNNLYMGRVTKAVHLLLAYVISSAGIYASKHIATSFPYLGSTGLLLGIIGIVVLLGNWVLEFFQILFFNPVDDEKKNIF